VTRDCSLLQSPTLTPTFPTMAGLPDSMADLQQLFQLGQQVQGRLQQLQSELANRTIETTAGGGMVRVTADGRGTVRAVSIDPTVFQDRDADFLSELVLTAVAEAQRRAAEMLQAEMRKVPPLPFASPF
jgi:DNA-binding YbaB/EbfC family protein